MMLKMNGKDLTSVRQYCEEMAKILPSNAMKYHSIYHFLLEHGKHFTIANPRPRVATGSKKQCWRNAAILAQNNPKLIYAEGLAVGKSGCPHPHAWCVDENGVVHEPSPSWQDGEEYFGVTFRTEYVIETMLRTEQWGSLIDNFREDFPILRGEEGWQLDRACKLPGVHT